MRKYLVCHTKIGDYVTAGKRYPVINEDADDYEITGDDGHGVWLTKEPFIDGTSYKTWFTLEIVEEAE